MFPKTTAADTHESQAAAIGLLNQTRALVAHEREIERVTASRFNLFQITGVGHLEVSTHSALIACLLDPEGSHRQGSAFLRLFLEMEKIRDGPGFPKDFDPASAVVEVEKRIGLKTATTGGRLDILLTDKNGRRIAIENKIHAAEQGNWVERYLEFLGKDGCLIYLTKHGDAAGQAREEQHGRIIRLSYAVDVREWLKNCRKESATVAIVRESLTQYLNLILDLTHQNRDNTMNHQIASSVLSSPENLEAYFALRNANKAVIGEVVVRLVERIKPRLSSAWETLALPQGNGAEYDGFYFTTDFLKAHNLKAGLSFDSADYQDCFYGFEVIDATKPAGRTKGIEGQEMERLRQCFKDTFGEDAHHGDSRWPAWRHWKRYQDWDHPLLRRIHFDHKVFDEELLGILVGLQEAALRFAKTP